MEQIISIEYKASAHSIEGNKAIEHKYNPDDIKLVGLNGYMWRSPSGFYSARITNHKTINKYWPNPDHRYKAGSDLLVHTKEVLTLIKRLKIPVDVEKQLDLIEHHDKGLPMPDFGPCRYA